MFYTQLKYTYSINVVEPPRWSSDGPKIPDWMSNNLARREK